MTVHEPATFLTDCFLAALAGGLAWRLPRTNPAQRWWRRALGLTALSALVGGGYHGFAPNFPAAVAAAWWLATLLLICLLSAAMALSLVHELAPPALQRRWTGVIACQLAAFGGAVIVHPNFGVAVLDYGLTMLAWAVAAFVVRRAWAGWMLAALALSALAAAVQQMHLSPARPFNHNDLYHLVQGLALVGFYQAGRKFGSGVAPLNRAGP